jgi:hypothetical protein
MAKKSIKVIEEVLKSKKDKKVMTLFFLMIPSVLLAMTSAIPSLIIRVGFQLVLILYHFVIFKNLLDTYMGED